jgi:hypothetical protein
VLPSSKDLKFEFGKFSARSGVFKVAARLTRRMNQSRKSIFTAHENFGLKEANGIYGEGN